ncbi:hypothetical protein HanHA300_Chr14g0517411 [Helianthus annuus]|nr:hypothetical protein HanHA300_Chr14g0517411 [Helianthus annuus]KAJ0485066.1 hypothetical protein HanHA89_Chr14g0563971 [Helianthus annuus]KAJ0655616.1 hypothetical protein HanLR1_Chr14g0526311 [Helianthus annuus]KAJ0659303.1 hypothetical protein HanOQP8_Chr14g0524551 [Helianthus annuus]
MGKEKIAMKAAIAGSTVKPAEPDLVVVYLPVWPTYQLLIESNHNPKLFVQET